MDYSDWSLLSTQILKVRRFDPNNITFMDLTINSITFSLLVCINHNRQCHQYLWNIFVEISVSMYLLILETNLFVNSSFIFIYGIITILIGDKEGWYAAYMVLWTFFR